VQRHAGSAAPAPEGHARRARRALQGRTLCPPSALFAPDPAKLSDFLSSSAPSADDDETEDDADNVDGGLSDEVAEAFQEAAE
jgi:hypothetical protein